VKISFSTLGCPEWSWEDMISTAKDFGFDGIEVRGIENELYIPKAKIFQAAVLEKTKEKLARLNLEIPCLTSSCHLFDKDKQEVYLQEGKDYIDLAAKLGTPYIRVLGDGTPEPNQPVDLNYVRENLVYLVKYAEGKRVTVLLETNGFFSSSDEMVKLMNKSATANVGVLWDIHHPFRFKNEKIAKTYDTLKDYIRFVHLKDSVAENGKIIYKMMGYGDIPVQEALLTLKKNKFTGYVSLEWVKRWCIELEDPGVVFAQFIDYVKKIIG
jgi:sugar phosphate isomerase/epimerase